MLKNLCNAVATCHAVLMPFNILMQVRWQETLRGHVAGIVTSHRVLIASANLDVLSSSSSKFDKGLPSISFSTLVYSLGCTL